MIVAKRLGFAFWEFLTDLPLEVSDVIGRDDDELPTVIAHDVKKIDLGGVAG